MLVGIRGTCGWVEVPDDGTMRVYLLEGRVECTAGENTAAINAGEMAALSPDGKIETASFTEVPGFVWAEVRDDEALASAILEMTGIDLTSANPLSVYAEVLGDTSGIVYTEELDFDGDGSTELLVINVRDSIGENGRRYRDDGFTLCKIEADRPRAIGWGGGNTHTVETYSLVESDGRLFVRRFSDTGYEGYYDAYFGFAASSDGGLGDWGTVDEIQVANARSHAVWVMPHKENGVVDFNSGWQGSDDSELSEVQGKYTHVRDLISFEGVG